MNLIAAVIFTDDICNDGCSRELHSKRLPRPPASDIEHTMMKAHLSVDLLAWLWQNKTTPENSCACEMDGHRSGLGILLRIISGKQV